MAGGQCAQSAAETQTAGTAGVVQQFKLPDSSDASLFRSHYKLEKPSLSTLSYRTLLRRLLFYWTSTQGLQHHSLPVCLFCVPSFHGFGISLAKLLCAIVVTSLAESIGYAGLAQLSLLEAQLACYLWVYRSGCDRALSPSCKSANLQQNDAVTLECPGHSRAPPTTFI